MPTLADLCHVSQYHPRSATVAVCVRVCLILHESYHASLPFIVDNRPFHRCYRRNLWSTKLGLVQFVGRQTTFPTLIRYDTTEEFNVSHTGGSITFRMPTKPCRDLTENSS